MNAFAFGAISGSLITRVTIGAIPAICGAIKGRMQLVIVGFLLVWYHPLFLE